MDPITNSPEQVPTDAGPFGEQAWIEVIEKMDEVYNDLLQYEVALEEKNAALEESQQFIESVLASMSDILIVCDRNALIVEVNPSLCRLVGKSAEALARLPLFALFADDAERERAHRIFSNLGRDGVADSEFFLRAGDGSTVPVSMNCTPRLSQTGKLKGMVVTGRPVGELRRAYHALRQAHEDLKRTQGQLLHAEKMVSLGRLVAGVAHELNNPISFVLGNVLSLRRYASRLESYLAAVHAGAGGRRSGVARKAGRIARRPHPCRHAGTDRRHDRRRRAHARHRRRTEAIFDGGSGRGRAGRSQRGRRARGALGGAKRAGALCAGH